MVFSSDTVRIDANDESFDDGQKEQKNWMDLENVSGWKLPVDIYETEDNIIIKAFIAGADAKDIEIILRNDMITIKGFIPKDEMLDNFDCLYKECKWGNFSRSIILPCQVQTDNIETCFKKRVLTITLSKKLDSETVNIKVFADNTDE